jgi:hypothetical protein
MHWRDIRRSAVVIVIVASGMACDRGAAPEDAAPGDETSLPEAGQLDAELNLTCDSLANWVNRAMKRGSTRHDGRYISGTRGVPRFGCRIVAADTIAPDVPQRPLELVWQSLAARGWTVDQAYVADEPEGSMLGLRSGTQLCVLTHSWQTRSDDERATRPEEAVPYEVSVECFREAPH